MTLASIILNWWSIVLECQTSELCHRLPARGVRCEANSVPTPASLLELLHRCLLRR